MEHFYTSTSARSVSLTISGSHQLSSLRVCRTPEAFLSVLGGAEWPTAQVLAVPCGLPSWTHTEPSHGPLLPLRLSTLSTSLLGPQALETQDPLLGEDTPVLQSTILSRPPPSLGRSWAQDGGVDAPLLPPSPLWVFLLASQCHGSLKCIPRNPLVAGEGKPWPEAKVLACDLFSLEGSLPRVQAPGTQELRRRQERAVWPVACPVRDWKHRMVVCLQAGVRVWKRRKCGRPQEEGKVGQDP